MMLLLNVSKKAMTPETEGVNHYNIYSRSRTELGMFLSHFTYHPIETYDGHFDSIEGYWYWIKYRDDALRYLSGLEAKQYGTNLGKSQIPLVESDSPMLRSRIIAATSAKLLSMPALLRFRLANSRLPLIHAYEHQGKYSFQSSMDFIIHHINRFRLEGHLK